MASLNRFPLLGLWASEAARHIGYNDLDAETLGHAYAVLYAIRANSPTRPVAYRDKDAVAAVEEVKRHDPEIVELEFANDKLQVSRYADGRLIGRVGNALPQTSETFRYKVRSKYPAGYFERVQAAFRDFFEAFTPEQLDTRLVYTLYDQWKKGCASGRMVDLDRLVQWCQERKPKVAAAV